MEYKRQRAKIQLKLIMRNTMPGYFSGGEQHTLVCKRTLLLDLIMEPEVCFPECGANNKCKRSQGQRREAGRAPTQGAAAGIGVALAMSHPGINQNWLWPCPILVSGWLWPCPLLQSELALAMSPPGINQSQLWPSPLLESIRTDSGHLLSSRAALAQKDPGIGPARAGAALTAVCVQVRREPHFPGVWVQDTLTGTPGLGCQGTPAGTRTRWQLLVSTSWIPQLSLQHPSSSCCASGIGLGRDRHHRCCLWERRKRNTLSLVCH